MHGGLISVALNQMALFAAETMAYAIATAELAAFQVLF
jgi:hypothetical protein